MFRLYSFNCIKNMNLFKRIYSLCKINSRVIVKEAFGERIFFGFL